MASTLRRRLVTTVIATLSALWLAAGPAFAGHCTVADKPTDAGIAVIIDVSGEGFEPVWFSQGAQKRIENVGMEHFFETFHGWIGFDLDGDGEAEVATLVPGNTEDGIPQLPNPAYVNGPDCHGTMDLHDYLANCV